MFRTSDFVLATFFQEHILSLLLCSPLSPAVSADPCGAVRVRRLRRPPRRRSAPRNSFTVRTAHFAVAAAVSTGMEWCQCLFSLPLFPCIGMAMSMCRCPHLSHTWPHRTDDLRRPRKCWESLPGSRARRIYMTYALCTYYSNVPVYENLAYVYMYMLYYIHLLLCYNTMYCNAQ